MDGAHEIMMARIKVDILHLLGFQNFPEHQALRMLKSYITSGNEELVETPANAEEDYTSSYLLAAVGKGDFEDLKDLIQKGADVNVVEDHSGKTALIHAAEVKDERCVCTLIEAGADVNVVAEDGTSALLAILDKRYGDMERDLDLDRQCIQLLIEAGADVNIMDWSKNTILNQISGLLFLHEFISMLLHYGARIDIKNRDGHNALTLFSGRRNSKSIRYVRFRFPTLVPIRIALQGVCRRCFAAPKL